MIQSSELIIKRFIFRSFFFPLLLSVVTAHSAYGISSTGNAGLSCRKIFLKSLVSGNSPSSSITKTPGSGSVKETVSSGSSIVINFVKVSVGKDLSQRMGISWSIRVRFFFRNWKAEEVMELLDYMESRIGRENTIKRLKSLSYFSLSGYKAFREKVSFFEEYLGEEAVTNLLRRSMGGFFTNKPLSKLKEIAEYLESYMGRKAVKKIMKKSPEKFSKISFSKLQEIVEYAKNQIGREALKKIMERDFFEFLKLFGYRYKSEEEAFNEIMEVEDQWKKAESEINDLFFARSDLLGEQFNRSYYQFESRRNKINEKVENLIERMANQDSNEVKAFQVRVTELMMSDFLTTFRQNITALRNGKENHREVVVKEVVKDEQTEKPPSLLDVTDPFQISPEHPYSYTTVDGRKYHAVFSEKYLDKIREVSKESPEYFQKVLKKMSYGVHGGSSKSSGVVFLNNQDIFEVRTLGGNINGFRSYGYKSDNVLHFIRFVKEGGHGSRLIANEGE